MQRCLFVCLMALCSCVTTPFCTDTGKNYLGTRYLPDPLGEEQSPDFDPLIRTDAFDCTTFVETVLAHENLEKLNKIRYKDGVPDFLARNHFIESDWLVNNSDFVENVSTKYGDTNIRKVIIDKQAWFKKVHNFDTNFKPVSVELEYIPYEHLSVLDIKKPMIVLFIVGNCEKCDKIGTDLAVVHMGFVLPDGMLRHASSSAGCVVDTNFWDYVQLRKTMKNNIGITLLEIK